MSLAVGKKRREGKRQERVLFFFLLFRLCVCVCACECDILSARPAAFALPCSLLRKARESSHILLILLPRHSAAEEPRLGSARLGPLGPPLAPLRWMISGLFSPHTHTRTPPTWRALEMHIRAAATEECLSLTHVALPRLSATY